jgi:hypothetical protein
MASGGDSPEYAAHLRNRTLKAMSDEADRVAFTIFEPNHEQVRHCHWLILPGVYVGGLAH